MLEPVLSANASAELTTLAVELEQRFEALERFLEHYRDQGEPGHAERALLSLALAAAGNRTWHDRANLSAADTLFTTQLMGEAEVEKKLDALLKPTLKSKPKKGLDKKLRDFAEDEASGTKVGARAARLAAAVARALGGL